MTKLLTFQEVIKIAKKPRILLGNGFSMSYDSKRFSFTSLLDSAVESGIINKNSKVYRVFQLLNTADFESVMRLLEQSKIIVDVYEGSDGVKKEIETDSLQLKKFLVKIITNNHPEKSTDIPVEQKAACANFLKLFKSIYTINYDLLLYWAIMQDDVATKKFSDNFGEDDNSIDEGYVVYQNASQQANIFFLHGALHLFDAGDKIIKETYSKTDVTLMEQTKENLDKGIYPIFVSEGESSQKMTKIIHNGYLNSCYKSLKNIGGDLVILGTYLKKNDEHILDAIIKSKLKNIYIGVGDKDAISHIEEAINEHNDEIKRHNKKNLDQRKKREEKKLFLYDYRTVNPRKYGNN